MDDVNTLECTYSCRGKQIVVFILKSIMTHARSTTSRGSSVFHNFSSTTFQFLAHSFVVAYLVIHGIDQGLEIFMQ